MDRPVADTPENAEQAELLELAEIAPETTVQAEDLPQLDRSRLAEALMSTDVVMSF